MVWKLDRLARSIKYLVEPIHELDDLGAGFRSLIDEVEHSLNRERPPVRSRDRTGGCRPIMPATDVREEAAKLADTQLTKAKVAKHTNRLADGP
ncbi:hypothetical protein BWR19_01650 [Halomonas sp. 1513]|nr:hypothetical protein BWR19_01650 [Halomonas sp. 1513]